MSNKSLKQESVVPFIKLLETNGMLHSEKFVGMGIHEDKLYLLKLFARPERVVVTNGEFAFLNKKADGPAFSPENGQSNDQAAQAYQFHGKDAGGFTDAMMIPESEMQRVMMIAALRRALESKANGQEPSEEDIVQHMFSELFQNPENAAQLIIESDPSVTHEEAHLAADMLGSAIADMASMNAQPQKPVDLSAEAVAMAEVADAGGAAPAPTPVVEVVRPVRGCSAIKRVVTEASLSASLFRRFGWA